MKVCLFHYNHKYIMHQLLRINNTIEQGLQDFPAWEILRRGLSLNLSNVVNYYHRFPGRVDGSHFLVKLISSMNVSKTISLDRFYATANSRALNLSKSLMMTSSISTGKVFDGVFYGEGVKEILIAHDEYFDFFEAAENWRSLQPIKVLSHPKSDLMINIPNGKSYSLEEGIAVIAINVPMLVLQYREYQRYEDSIALAKGESPRGLTHYIYSYALTNMLYSHLDIAVFNRLYNLLVGAPLGESDRKHSFYIQDYSDKVTDLQLLQLRTLERNPRKLDAMMKMVPLVTESNLSELVKLPDMVPTRQVVWALVLGRLQTLSFLYNASVDEARVRNGSEVNRISRMFELFSIESILERVLPVDLFLDCKRQVDRIQNA